MDNKMKAEITKKLPNSFLAYPAIASLMLYVFCYQFAYPFSSTLFLYIAFGCTVIWMIFSQKIYLSTQMLMMALVSFVAVIGAFYSDIPEKGNREAILTVVVWILLVAFAQSAAFLSKIKKTIYIFSFAVFIGVMFQYLFADTANDILGVVLRSDCYEQLMWSYEVDGAYAGFSAYTPDAAFFCAALFGFTIFGLLENKNISFKNKAIKLIIVVLSVFAVILTSKRGVAVALLVSFVLTYMIWKKFSVKAVASTVGLVVIGAVIVSILSEQNEVINLFLQRFDSTDGDITTGRSEIWQRAIESMTNEIFGMGTGSAYAIHDTGLHNIYLQLYYDHGLIGAMIYLLFFINNLVRAISRKEPMAIYIQLLMLVYGMSGNPIYSNSFFIVYIIFSIVVVGERKHTAVAQS